MFLKKISQLFTFKCSFCHNDPLTAGCNECFTKESNRVDCECDSCSCRRESVEASNV